MTLTNIVTWIVFGLIVGVVANALDTRPNRMGIVGSIALGILGAVLGGLVAGLFGYSGVTGFNLYSFLVALIGALVVLWVGRGMLSPTSYGAEMYDETMYDEPIEDRDPHSRATRVETTTKRVTHDDRDIT